ncbi:MAG: paraquat-inducible membrane protein A [Verrucomicrobia bacterium]|nr:MAG: paraquat-inducible membrane protein A [Verrucomicrobiota bacterium]
MRNVVIANSRGIDRGLASCHSCGKVSPVTLGRCPRCGSHLHLRKPQSVARTVAFMIGAVAFYIPANLLPVMTITELGIADASTITEGMVTFWKSGAYPIALVIFTASILIPFLKIIALTWLCLAATGKVPCSPAGLSRIYWFTELMGRWSMIDIFVVGILVALVQLGNYMTIVPELGAVAFAFVVILTMFAAMCFDPRLLWDQVESKFAQEAPMPMTPQTPSTL